jgi:hypothetical protein
MVQKNAVFFWLVIGAKNQKSIFCRSRRTSQPVEKPLAEITKGRMSLIAERLILWERRGKSKHKGSDGEKAKG